jgi:hypothetical protein
MSSGVPEHSARRTVTYAAAAVVDPDGVKTSFATVAAPVVLDVTDWNGAVLNGSGALNLARTITITLSNSANQFSLGDYVLTGVRNGTAVTETLTAADNDGNVTLRGTQPFDSFDGLTLPTMDGTGGTITIGVQDICAPKDGIFTGVELAAAGTLNVAYGGTDLVPAHTDAIPIGTAAVGSIKPIACKRILTSGALASPTAVGLTVYMP